MPNHDSSFECDNYYDIHVQPLQFYGSVIFLWPDILRCGFVASAQLDGSSI